MDPPVMGALDTMPYATNMVLVLSALVIVFSMSRNNPAKLAHEARTRSIIGGFFEVYNHLGHGYRESVHAAALERELIRRGHRVAREVNVRVYYKGEHIAWERVDMIVDDCVIVENKSSANLPPESILQLKNYLGSTWIEVGLLFHFGPKPRFYREYWPNERKAEVLSADPDHGHQHMSWPRRHSD